MYIVGRFNQEFSLTPVEFDNFFRHPVRYVK